MTRENQKETVLCRGIDCASKVLAYTYAEHLFRCGIIGKPLHWRLLKKNYACGFISSFGCFDLNKADLRREPGDRALLWRPEEVPEEIWQQAVERFTFHSLEENLLRHLFPLLGKAEELVPREKLLDLTEQLFVDAEILNCPIRKVRGGVYYFNDERIYTKAADVPHADDTQHIPHRRHSVWYIEKINLNVWNKALPKFREGDTLRECIEQFFQTELVSVPLNYSYLDRLVTRIEPPEYERVPGNDNAKTFDRVRVHVNLSHTLHPAMQELVRAVKEHRKEIDAMVLTEIETDKKFRRFGVPVNVLQLGALTLHGRALEYIFEVKGNYPLV